MVNVDRWWDGLVRDRRQAVRDLVLVAVADDYMTLEVILKTLNEGDAEQDSETWPARRVTPVSRPEVLGALRDLTRERYVEACIFIGRRAQAADGRQVRARDVWFCATDKGLDAARQIQKSE